MIWTALATLAATIAGFLLGGHFINPRNPHTTLPIALACGAAAGGAVLYFF